MSSRRASHSYLWDVPYPRRIHRTVARTMKLVATPSPRSFPHNETRLHEFIEWLPTRRLRFAVPTPQLPVIDELVTPYSPRSCPRDELAFDDTHPTVARTMSSSEDATHLTVSRAMSFTRCAPFAVARVLSTPPDTTHFAASRDREVVFRHPAVSRLPARLGRLRRLHLQRFSRATVLAPQRSTGWLPKRCVRFATPPPNLVSQFR